MSRWKYEQRGNTFNNGKPMYKRRYTGGGGVSERDFETDEFYANVSMEGVPIGDADYEQINDTSQRIYGKPIDEQWAIDNGDGTTSPPFTTMQPPTRNPMRAPQQPAGGPLDFSNPFVREAIARALANM